MRWLASIHVVQSGRFLSLLRQMHCLRNSSALFPLENWRLQSLIKIISSLYSASYLVCQGEQMQQETAWKKPLKSQNNFLWSDCLFRIIRSLHGQYSFFSFFFSMVCNKKLFFICLPCCRTKTLNAKKHFEMHHLQINS